MLGGTRVDWDFEENIKEYVDEGVFGEFLQNMLWLEDEGFKIDFETERETFYCPDCDNVFSDRPVRFTVTEGKRPLLSGCTFVYCSKCGRKIEKPATDDELFTCTCGGEFIIEDSPDTFAD